MARVVQEIEGTREDIRAHDAELTGKQVKLQVLEAGARERIDAPGLSTTRWLLENVQGWDGDDFEECLEAVYRTRLPVER